MASDTIEQAIRATLVASATVHAYVADRIFFALADQEATQPYCVFQTISDPHTPMAFDSPATGQARIQFTVVDDDRYNVLNAAHAIRDCLDQYGAAMDGITVYALNCTGIVEYAEDDNTFVAHFDALIQYKDA